MTLRSWRISLAGLTLAAVVLAACQSPPRNPPVTSDIQSRMSANLHPALHDTIGEFSALVDAAPVRVEGWGLVGELPNTGSPTMDQRLYQLMLNKMLKLRVGEYSTGTQNISPEAILASSKISVVEVRGIIPPLASKGTTFDLYINTLPGSGTTSLANGILWPSDLKQFGLTLENNDSRTLATGRGPVFLPGPLEALAAAGAKPADARKAQLSGRVIAGGICVEDREARLQLYAPDWVKTRLIERTINSHFPGRDKAATANDDSTISLHIPAEYKDNPMDFVDLARHLYITTDEPGFVERKAAEIIAALQDPATPHRDLGLALQGLGRSILPDYIQPYYTSPNQELRFWCARAGACLQDEKGMGMTTLLEMARNPQNSFRRQALQAMIEASRGHDTERVTMALVDMIRSYNTDDRLQAYHALLALRSRAVYTYNIGRKFMVDVIPADSPPLIYVLESETPRIAFIGPDINLPQGALFYSKDRLLTVQETSDTPVAPPPRLGGGMGGLVPAAAPAAKPREETVMLFWRSPLGDKEALLYAAPYLPAIVARACWIPDPLAAGYDSKAPFIGVSYQRITELLAGMCTDKTIDATFVVQHAPDELISPTDQALSGRPEGSTRVPSPATAPSSMTKPPAIAPGATDVGLPKVGTPLTTDH